MLKWGAVPELAWGALPSGVAFSLCHVGVVDWGMPSEMVAGNLQMGSLHYAGGFEVFLAHNEDVLRGITVFHFPCVVSAGRKGALASLALSSILRLRYPQKAAKVVRPGSL